MFNENEAPVELAIQELEALDAPGWGTWIGRSVGVSVISAVYT